MHNIRALIRISVAYNFVTIISAPFSGLSWYRIVRTWLSNIDPNDGFDDSYL